MSLFDCRFFGDGSSSGLRAVLPVEKQVDLGVASDYLLFGKKDHSRRTFFRGVRQEWEFPSFSHSRDTRRVRYGDVSGFDEELACVLDDGLGSGVKLSCLSGGLDSSAIVGLTGVDSVSAVFEENLEEDFIDDVVEYNDIQGDKLFLSASDVVKCLDDVIGVQGEPFRSLSVVAEYLLYKKVGRDSVFCGQGADELLGGYEYFWPLYCKWLAGRIGPFALAEWARVFSHNKIGLAGFFFHSLPFALRRRIAAGRLDGVVSPVESGERFRVGGLFDVLDGHLRWDSLPELLNYARRNAGAFRTSVVHPFLDERVVEASASLPLGGKFYRGWNKYVLRLVSDGFVPVSVRRRRRKVGFSVPEDSWLRDGELADVLVGGFDGFEESVLVDWGVVGASFDRWLAGDSCGGLSGRDFFRFYCYGRWKELMEVEE